MISALEQDLLTVLATSPYPLYGLQILGIINTARLKFSRPELKIGSLYPALDRLKEKELVVESNDGTTARRYYTVTPLGAQALADLLSYRDRLRFSRNT